MIKIKADRTYSFCVLLLEYYDVLVVYNQTWCQAFLRPNIRQWIGQVKTTKSCKVTFCPNQSGEDQKKGKRREGKEMTDECDTKLKVSFEVKKSTTFVFR